MSEWIPLVVIAILLWSIIREKNTFPKTPIKISFQEIIEFFFGMFLYVLVLILAALIWLWLSRGSPYE